MADFFIKSKFSPAGGQQSAIDALVAGINKNISFQTFLGVTGAGKTFTMANVIKEIKKPTLILSHNKTLAAQLYGEFKSLFPKNAVEYFISYYDYYQPEAYLPVSDTFIEKDSSVNEEIDRLRLKATTSLMSREDVIVIASVSSIYGIGSPENYKNMLIQIKKNEILDTELFFKSLIDIHYTRNDISFEPGSFRVRGDVIEVYPIYDSEGLRIELFGDVIDEISTFDPLTGNIINSFKKNYIYPAKHFVTTEKKLQKAIKGIRNELNERLRYFQKENLLLEHQRLEQRTTYDIEMMQEIGFCSGIENYSRHIDGRKKGERPFTLIDFFPDDFLMFIDESHMSIPQIKAMYNGDRARKETLVAHGFRLPSALDNRPMKFQEFENKINNVVYVSATPAKYELEKSKVLVEQIIRPTGLLDPIIVVRPIKNQIDNIIQEVRQTVLNNKKIIITTLTKKSSEDLSEYLKNINIKAEYLHSEINTIDRIKILRELRLNKFDVLVGINLLREGIDLPEVALVIVLDADKEGFLRSKSALMQLAGRAARNKDGRVILYADKKTDAIKYLIHESERRRKKQVSYNKKHNIIPKTIYKSKNEIIKSTSIADQSKIIDIVKDDVVINSNILDKLEFKEKIKFLNKQMLESAQNLQFEKAAIIRDKIDKLKKQFTSESNK